MFAKMQFKLMKIKNVIYVKNNLLDLYENTSSLGIEILYWWISIN